MFGVTCISAPLFIILLRPISSVYVFSAVVVVSDIVTVFIMLYILFVMICCCNLQILSSDPLVMYSNASVSAKVSQYSCVN